MAHGRDGGHGAARGAPVPAVVGGDDEGAELDAAVAPGPQRRQDAAGDAVVAAVPRQLPLQRGAGAPRPAPRHAGGPPARHWPARRGNKPCRVLRREGRGGAGRTRAQIGAERVWIDEGTRGSGSSRRPKKSPRYFWAVAITRGCGRRGPKEGRAARG